MKNKYSHFELEDFLLDDEFFRIVKSHTKGYDTDKWNQLLQCYPEKKAVLDEAYRIIICIRIREIQVEEIQISEDWNRLIEKIRRRKIRRQLYWISSAVACLIFIIAGTRFFSFTESVTDKKQELLSLLTDLETESDAIQLILGKDNKTTIEEDANIREKDDGSLTINNDTEIEADGTLADYIQLIVPKGKRSYLELKDGSRIWINSGSKLLYPSRFNEDRRDIYVDGELYLEVATKASSPFFVHTSSLDVKVVGTSFNVSAYSDDSFTEVVLVTGNVEVKTENKTTTLTPNTCYHLEDSQEQVKQVDVYSYICWKDGIMRMNGEELKDIFKRLSRYYNVDIMAPAELEQVHYFGKLGLEDDIERVLYNISLVEPIVFERDGNLIRIHPQHK